METGAAYRRVFWPCGLVPLTNSSVRDGNSLALEAVHQPAHRRAHRTLALHDARVLHWGPSTCLSLAVVVTGPAGPGQRCPGRPDDTFARAPHPCIIGASPCAEPPRHDRWPKGHARKPSWFQRSCLRPWPRSRPPARPRRIPSCVPISFSASIPVCRDVGTKRSFDDESATESDSILLRTTRRQASM